MRTARTCRRLLSGTRTSRVGTEAGRRAHRAAVYRQTGTIAAVAVPPTSLWRRAFDRAERAVGGPLERTVQTRGFADVVVLSVKLQRALWGAFERNTRAVLHAWNLPARTDVERLNRQVAALRNELREFVVRFDDAPK
jgi:hypothetical protein